jgi:hypothetical protein
MADHLLHLGINPIGAVALFPVGSRRINLTRAQWKVVALALAQVFGGRWPGKN